MCQKYLPFPGEKINLYDSLFRYDYLDEEYYGYDDIAVDEEFTPEFLTSPSNLKVNYNIKVFNL